MIKIEKIRRAILLRLVDDGLSLPECKELLQGILDSLDDVYTDLVVDRTTYARKQEEALQQMHYRKMSPYAPVDITRQTPT